MPTIKSRFNGLIVAVPTDARGIMGRFLTKGGNELIFDQNSTRAKAAAEPEAPIKVESEAPDKGASAHEADIA